MRVAYVCADPGVPVFGQKGCSVHVQEILRAFIRRGASVDLFASRIGGQRPRGLELVRVHRLPPPDTPDIAARERQALAANDDLRGALDRRGPFDMVYERYALWSFAGMQYARTAAVPALLEVNAPLIEEQARHRVLVDRPAAERVARSVFGDATAIAAVSAEVAAAIGLHGRALPISVVPNGVDVRRFRPDVPPAFPAAAGTFTVGFVGTLKPWHGLQTLVEGYSSLAKRHSNVRLLVVGAGPGSGDLESALAAHGVRDRSLVTGSVLPADVPSLLTSMTVAVAPYALEAGFYFSPLKLFEYMAAGLPIVANGVGQVATVIEDGVTGLLCPAGDPEALGAAFERLYHDRELRARLGRAARAQAVREHSWDSVCRRLLEVAGLRSGDTALEANA